ncbi:MAG: acyltransferase family protein [Nitrobacter sp.]
MAAKPRRTEIDGLRCVAVAGILLFHLNPKWLPGGYVGVDVFFVISGFLITGLIARPVRDGAFNMKDFYLRRWRRLFPAMAVTIAASLAFAGIIFPPSDLIGAAGSAIASTAWLANFYFHAQSGYFDPAHITKPLLHLWSLAVEEQFYLLWAPAIWLAGGRGRALGFIVAGGLASVVLSALYRESESATFFLPWFRIQEFAVGSVLVWLPASTHDRTKNLASIVGLILIVGSMFLLNERTQFPFYNAIWPCVGTALVIWSGEGVVAALLSLPPFQWVGRISYSLYLTHWPVIVFWTYLLSGSVSNADRTGMAAVALVLAVPLYWFVERRYQKRKNQPDPAFHRAVIGVAVLTVLVSAHIWSTSGWTWRFPSIGPALAELAKLDLKKNYELNNTIGKEEFDPSAARKVLVIGDSYQADFFDAMHLNTDQKGGVQFRSERIDDACFYQFAGAEAPESIAPMIVRKCDVEVKDFKISHKASVADVIVVSTKWDQTGVDYLAPFIEWTKSHYQARLILLGRPPEFRDVPAMLADYSKLRAKPLLSAYAARTRDGSIDGLNAQIKSIADAHGVEFISKDRWVCPESFERCDILDAEGHPLIFDTGHWTLAGAKFYGANAVRQGLIARFK